MTEDTLNTATNEEAQEMVSKGEATIPTEAKMSEDGTHTITDSEAILDAIKELTKVVADMAKKVNTMEATHSKWVKAGKF